MDRVCYQTGLNRWKPAKPGDPAVCTNRPRQCHVDRASKLFSKNYENWHGRDLNSQPIATSQALTNALNASL